jgi:glycosyltransferase involved in cell wall biosynthesis
MENILIITNYYPPEKGAAANRIEQLALSLSQNNYKVSVVCPLANYPKGIVFPEYKGKFTITENRDSITVKRLWIYPSISKNIFIRSFSILSFAICLFGYLLFKKTPKKIIIQSPPLLLSFIAILILSLKRKKIILNVSDLWPLAALELNALKEGSLSHKCSLYFERYIYKKATIILGQSLEIIAHVQSLFLDKKCFLYRNYPDHKISEMSLITSNDSTIRIFYAGLLGVAQGVLELCENIQLQELNIELHLFGDGAEKNQIEHFISSQTQSKIFFHGMLERNELHKTLNSFDIAIVPLKTRIYGSVPSKIYEYSCLGFPVLYFGGGEAESVVDSNQLGWVAKVGDFDDLKNKIISISKIDKQELHLMKKRIFNETKSIFNLEKQIKDLIQEKVF